MAARHVIAAALSDRREQLTGEASPLDYAGARMVLVALESEGFAIIPNAAEYYTAYQWRPKSDPRFGTGDGPGWIHANSNEHALHMIKLWQAEVRQHQVGPWQPFLPEGGA